MYGAVDVTHLQTASDGLIVPKDLVSSSILHVAVLAIPSSQATYDWRTLLMYLGVLRSLAGGLAQSFSLGMIQREIGILRGKMQHFHYQSLLRFYSIMICMCDFLHLSYYIGFAERAFHVDILEKQIKLTCVYDNLEVGLAYKKPVR